MGKHPVFLEQVLPSSLWQDGGLILPLPAHVLFMRSFLNILIATEADVCFAQPCRCPPATLPAATIKHPTDDPQCPPQPSGSQLVNAGNLGAQRPPGSAKCLACCVAAPGE